MTCGGKLYLETVHALVRVHNVMCWCLSVCRADFELQVDHILALRVVTARVSYVLGRKDKRFREESCGLPEGWSDNHEHKIDFRAYIQNRRRFLDINIECILNKNKKAK